MFGLGKKRNDYDQQNMQIPYQVYETVHEPTARRQRLAIRLIAALIVGTLLVFGGIALRRALSHDAAPANQGQSNGQGQNGQDNNAQPPGSVVQSPQQNTALPNPGPAPAAQTPADAVNKGTVNKPE
jgi:hypothetical protein